jgi:hypothetical protein
VTAGLVGAGQVADGEDHHGDDQAEGGGDAAVAHRPAGDAVDHDRPGAGEDQAEGAERLGAQAARQVRWAAHGNAGYCIDIYRFNR